MFWVLQLAQKAKTTMNLCVLGVPACPKDQNNVNLRVLNAPADRKSQNAVFLRIFGRRIRISHYPVPPVRAASQLFVAGDRFSLPACLFSAGFKTFGPESTPAHD